MTTDLLLPIRPRPRARESLPGFVVRAAASFGMKIGSFLYAIGAVESQGSTSGLFTARHWLLGEGTQQLDAVLAQRLGLDDGDFRALRGVGSLAADESRVLPRRRLPASCPECLQRDPLFWPIDWWNTWVFACPAHELVLQECKVCWVQAMAPNTRQTDHSCVRVSACREALAAQGAVAELIKACRWRRLDEVASALVLFLRLDVADGTVPSPAVRSGVRWIVEATRPHRMHALVRDAVQLHGDASLQVEVRQRLVSQRASALQNLVAGLVLPRRVTSAHRKTPLTPTVAFDAEHASEWPQLLPSLDGVDSSLDQLLPSMPALRLRAIAVLLAMRSSETTLPRSISALGYKSRTDQLTGIYVIRRAAAAGDIGEFWQTCARNAALIDAAAVSHRWGNRRGVLRHPELNLDALRRRLDGHPAGTAGDGDLLLWAWCAWGLGDARFSPTSRGDSGGRNRDELLVRAAALLDQCGDAPKSLNGLLTSGAVGER